MDLRRDFVITGIATQGFDYFVRSYNLSHSRDGHTWSIFPVSINLSFCDVNSNDDNDKIYSDFDNDNNNMFPVFPLLYPPDKQAFMWTCD